MSNQRPQALGRSRGVIGTKIHVVYDRNGLPLQVLLTGNETHDSKMLVPVLSKVNIKHNKPGCPKCNPKCVVADKAYDSAQTRTFLRKKGIKSLLPKRKYKTAKKEVKRGRKAFWDDEMYKERNVIERLFCWIKECRRIRIRYEKKASNFLSMIKLDFIKIYFQKHFSDRP